ncbi:MAG: HIT family protein [Planctomycetota bacterium]|jgi:ATP adenylyltransferase
MDNEILWAPWRADFIMGEKEEGCPLCNAFEADDTVQNLIVYRGETCFVILNKFPYNSGHAMVCPNRHVATLEELTKRESDEMFDLIRTTVGVLKRVCCPHSFNIGMNIGEGSGAGIPEHLHMHIVPRWNGDTSFIVVLGKTKVVSIPLEPVYERVKAEFDKL